MKTAALATTAVIAPCPQRSCLSGKLSIGFWDRTGAGRNNATKTLR